MIRFVTGTDTGVGKTICSAVLARRALDDGQRVRYVKPIQTGADDDAAVVARWDVDARTLVRLPDPLAPAVAAALAGCTIDVDDLVRQILALAEGVDLLLVEGAGGLLVPITDDTTMADLAKAVGAELIVVVRPGLGTLNHTALTLEAAAARGLRVAQIVVSNYPDAPSLTERTNLEQLEQMGPSVEVVGHVQRVDALTGPS